MMPDLLQTVVAAARRSALERARRGWLPGELGLRDTRAGSGRFQAALEAPGIRIVAECKRRSPSRGVIRPVFDPAGIARGYEAAGAAAVSVLTEPTFFDGSLEHLAEVRRAVTVPVLRKDFIVTEQQVLEAKAVGADAVLLIVAAMTVAELGLLMRAATREGLGALVEVHDRRELDVALDAGARIVGVNSRNLRTLEVDRSVFETLAARLPGDVVAVAESGLQTSADLRRLAGLGYRAFLIGERFMAAEHPGEALAALMSGAEQKEAR
ncbi:MAG TPA: indole-3-glycerol phosphate synthase TrpC [Vicinamibacterales bacterium]|nr:indole-3-glycerol phosphate synthase TrpC [Vicinamibacterales bacterium]